LTSRLAIWPPTAGESTGNAKLLPVTENELPEVSDNEPQVVGEAGGGRIDRFRGIELVVAGSGTVNRDRFRDQTGLGLQVKGSLLTFYFYSQHL